MGGGSGLRSGRKWAYRLAALGLACAVLNGGAAASATAPEVVISSDAVSREPAEGGTSSGSVAVSNGSDLDLTVTATVPSQPGCAVEVSGSPVRTGRSATLELSFGSGCPSDEGFEVLIAPGSSTPATVAVKPASSKPSVDWALLRSSLLVPLVIAALIAIYLLLRVRKINSEAGSEEAREILEAKRADEQARWASAWTARGLDGKVPTVPAVEPQQIGPGTELSSLDTDWSFKDAWVSNATIGSAALLALLGSTDVLTAALGDNPKNAVATITIVAAVGALFVSLGPLVLKVIGPQRETATVAGVLAAAVTVVFGSLYQVTAITRIAVDLAPSGLTSTLIGVGGVAVGALIVAYSLTSLEQLVLTGTTVHDDDPTDQVRAAWVVAGAIRPAWAQAKLTPLEIDEILAGMPDLPENVASEPRIRALMSSAPDIGISPAGSRKPAWRPKAATATRSALL